MSTTTYAPNINVGTVQLSTISESTDLVYQGGSLSPIASFPPGTSAFQGSASLIPTAPTSNTAVYLPGPTGNYLNFGGTSPGNFDTTTSNLFVECWFYSIGPGGGGDGRIQQMAAVSGPTVSTTEVWGLIYQNSALNLVQFFMYPTSGAATSVTLSVTLNYGNWYYLAGSWNAQTKTCYVFCNGVASAGATMTGTPRAYSTSYSFMIGADFNTGNTAYGYMRDLRVIKGGIVPTTNFTPEAAPFNVVNSPSYAPQGLNVFTLLGQFTSSNNSTVINQWFNKNVNTITPISGTPPYWANASSLSYATTGTTQGGAAYQGGVLLPDGRVIFVPYNAQNVGIFNPATNSFTTSGAITIGTGAGNGAFNGGALLPDGRVIFAPANATSIGIFNPVSNAFSLTGTTPGSLAFYGNVVLPDGRVLIVPESSTGIGLYNPATNSYTTTRITSVLYANGGGVLLPDGRVIFVPAYATSVGIYDPVTNFYTTAGTISGTGAGAGAYTGGVLVPDGRVIFVPASATTIGIFNPATNAYTTSGTTGGSYAYVGGVLTSDGRVVFVSCNATNFGLFNPIGNSFTTFGTTAGGTAFSGGVALPDGRIVLVPYNSTSVGIITGFPPTSPDMCLHPFFNKY